MTPPFFQQPQKPMRWQLMCHHPADILETETKNVLVPTQSAIALCHPRPWGAGAVQKSLFVRECQTQGSLE